MMNCKQISQRTSESMDKNLGIGARMHFSNVYLEHVAESARGFATQSFVIENEVLAHAQQSEEGLGVAGGQTA